MSSNVGTPGDDKIPIQIQSPTYILNYDFFNSQGTRVFVKKGALVSFIIKHRYSYKLRKTIIATSPQFPVLKLLECQQNQGADQSISIPLSSTSAPSKSATLQVKVWPRAFNRPQDLAEKDKTALKERMDLIKQKSLQAAENLKTQFSALAFASRGSPMEPLIDVASTLLDALTALRDHPSVSQRMDGADSAKHGDVIANVVNDASDAFTKVIRESKSADAKLLKSTEIYGKYEQDIVSGVVHAAQMKNSKKTEVRDVVANNPSLGKLQTISVFPPLLYDPPTAYHSDCIRKLTKWALTSLKTNPASTANTKPLFWMYGSASCGKTQTTAQLIETFNHMGFPATYFSFNESGHRKTSALLEHLPATLAYQISTHQSEVAQYVCDAVKSHPNICDTPLDTQMKQLVIDALHTMVKDRAGQKDTLPVKPLLIVLDDVDRCSVEEQNSLADLLHRWFVGHGDELPAPSFVRVLLLVVFENQHVPAGLTAAPDIRAYDESLITFKSYAISEVLFGQHGCIQPPGFF
ncbi:uncharacterized protein LACBIDRAFT_295762 [Laccaria bicolor S238N-H82]|uniref:Predicted protein n=1 Tax=Laccaria bicolor (strain S238N-H82 / ATCC MYA-4686) TaxID=486041 RepID=B0DXX1_LACBS|nr:uncharacterized protein LACBIDRAFT_295762 [Laccaria bicolor S238N-H82]EDR00587.1 predicted protein [Laccaria bicolor S238N-H82]|eukprot:XP_001888814.1 predicted protein [Laccaria bicolor S238N-H82]